MDQQQTPPQDQTVFPAEEFSMDGYDKHIRNARIVLLIIAALQLLAIYMIPEYIDDTTKTVATVIYATLAVVFVCLAICSWKKPWVGILSGLILYALLVLLDLIANPTASVGGLFGLGVFGYIIKGVIIVFLVLGLKNAIEIREARKTFGQNP